MDLGQQDRISPDCPRMSIRPHHIGKEWRYRGAGTQSICHIILLGYLRMCFTVCTFLAFIFPQIVTAADRACPGVVVNETCICQMWNVSDEARDVRCNYSHASLDR